LEPQVKPDGHSVLKQNLPIEMKIFDERTERNIATLVPKAQIQARVFMEEALRAMEPHGVIVKIISGDRSYNEQNELYAQGRTKPGKIVTNAKGGQSWHNHGVAFDIGLFKGGKYLEESPLYAACGKIGQSLGFDWGGAWRTFKDEPHFQISNGKTLAQAQALHKQGKTIFD
jgi:peptidoglycan L-alanyl-D-glutamate endopeptidase CwlK